MADEAEKVKEETENVQDETNDKPVDSIDELVKVEKEVSNPWKSDCSKRDLEIIRQVEYYFGDNNLIRDKFLLDQISKNEEGWVPLSVLLTFKRLASICTDAAVIADALMKSTEGLVEVNEDKTKLRRHPERPIPEHNEERRKEIMSRTVYVKGFPTSSDMNTLLEYFKTYDKVVNVYMRKYLDKPSKSYKFKGSVFITFELKEQAEKFLEQNDVSYNNVKLICKWQEKYLADKREEHKAKNKKKEEKQKAEEEEKIVFPKGSVLYFEGASGDMSREDLRESFEKAGQSEIAYIDFSKGEIKGNVRFATEGSAAKFLENVNDSKLKIKDDVEIVLRTLTDDEEKAYFAKVIEAMKSRRQHYQKNRKRRGGNNERRDVEKKQKQTAE